MYPTTNPSTSRVADTTPAVVQSTTVTTEVVVRVLGDEVTNVKVVVSGNVIVSLTVVMEVFSTVTVAGIAVVTVYVDVTSLHLYTVDTEISPYARRSISYLHSS